MDDEEYRDLSEYKLGFNDGYTEGEEEIAHLHADFAQDTLDAWERGENKKTLMLLVNTLQAIANSEILERGEE